MANEPKSHRGLLDIIGEKEAELSQFRHATERAIEKEGHRDRQQYLQLRSDFEHNLNLLFQKDELIRSLQTQLMENKNQYDFLLKDSEEQNEKVVEKKIGQIQSALEEEWYMNARRNDEEQRKRLEVEYEDKLSHRQKTLYAEHQDSILSKLRNQEKDLWIGFDKITKEKECWYEKLEKDLREKITTKERENASIIATVEGKWGERESDLSQKIAAEFELKMYKARQEAEHSQKESQNKIAKMIQEQRQLIRQGACFNHDIQELHEVNDELNRKVHDLLGVIESTERGFMTKVRHFLETEASTKKDMQLNCDHIISLQTEVNMQSVHHEKFTTQLKNKWSNEETKFHDNITALKKELKNLRVEMKRIQASEENAKYSEKKLKNDIDSLNQCSELKDNLKCLQEKLNLNIESMSVLQRDNGNLKCRVSESSASVQQKDAIIFQLKDQILEDTRSLEEKQHQLAKERDTILNEKEACRKTIVALRNELESVELKLFQTREDSGKSSLVESRKLSDLTYSLQRSQLENNKLKETVALMRKEMESVVLRPKKSPTHTTPQSSFLVHSDNKLKNQLEDLRSQLNLILNGGKSETNDDHKDSSKHRIEDLSIFKNSLQELNSIVECLRNVNMRSHMHISQTCTNLPDIDNDTQIQIFELSNELNAVILERNSLLELSNKLRSDLYKLNSSIPTLGLEIQAEGELRQKTDLSNSISTHSSSGEVDSGELAQSLWTRVVGAENSNTKIAKKFPLRASDRATASQRMSALRLRTEERKTENKYKAHSKHIKVRNWCHKDD